MPLVPAWCPAGEPNQFVPQEHLAPQLDGPWWKVAGNPDLGPWTDPQQQPVDFAIWQAADGTWQLWSCIRHTRCRGRTRLFYRWEGKQLTDPDWRPCGVSMTADERFGEAPGGLQATHVICPGGRWKKLYGNWHGIALAQSTNGKEFHRVLDDSGKGQGFTEDLPDVPANTRDPMVLPIGSGHGVAFYCYYTAHPKKQGPSICVRRTT